MTTALLDLQEICQDYFLTAEYQPIGEYRGLNDLDTPCSWCTLTDTVSIYRPQSDWGLRVEWMGDRYGVELYDFHACHHWLTAFYTCPIELINSIPSLEAAFEEKLAELENQPYQEDTHAS
jgi:hypothetical protein